MNDKKLAAAHGEVEKVIDAGQLLLDRKACAKAMQLGERTIARLTADGELPCVRIGKSVRYDSQDLQDLIRRWKNKEPGNG